jgi:hypothetical protein
MQLSKYHKNKIENHKHGTGLEAKLKRQGDSQPKAWGLMPNTRK